MVIMTASDIPSFKWGIVTGVNPLQIKLDGDTLPLALIPDAIGGGFLVGDRIRVEMSKNRVIVHGKANSPNGQKITDWNTAITPGFYYATSALNGPVAVDGGSGSWMMGVVTYHDGNGGAPRIKQRLSEARGSTEDTEYVRYFNGTSWSAWVAVQNGILRGPSSARSQYKSSYWDKWYDTGNGYLYVGNKSGGWRRFSGEVSFGAKAWDTTATNLAGRTESFTVPTTLESNEELNIFPLGVGTGFGFISVVNITKNPTNTSVSIRFMQILSIVTQGLRIGWQIVPL